TIAGKRLPAVMSIGARALTSQGLNVHAGHDDVMSVADCGWGMLFARNAQEAGDFCLIARRAAEATFTPFFNVQDGFLTTHTVETVRLAELEFMKEYIGDPKQKLMNLMDPASPMMSGVVQNQDSYMKGKIAQRWYYDRIAPALTEAFDEFFRKTGRRYGFVESYQCEDADYVLVGMGCYMETAKATVDYLRSKGIHAIENMVHEGPDFFCVGIDHPLALKRTDDPDLRPRGGFSMRGHSVGGFGSVTTNKVIATIAGNVFGKDVQAYPKYGSEKKGL